MVEATTTGLTVLLDSARAGSPAAREQLFEHAYARLRALAAQHLGREAACHTFNPTDLLHEAVIRILESELPQNAVNGAYFLGSVSRAMRRVLVDHARGRDAVKRGGRPLPLDALADYFAERKIDVAALREALDELEKVHERASQVITLRTLGGFTAEEVAARLGVSLSTVEKDTRFARAWLRNALGDGRAD